MYYACVARHVTSRQIKAVLKACLSFSSIHTFAKFYDNSGIETALGHRDRLEVYIEAS
jgi:hypothetical protein